MFECFQSLPKLPIIFPPRFRIYIDGYNFYGAINHPTPEWLYGLGWCNFHELGRLLIPRTFDVPGGSFQLHSKYFTARVPRADYPAEQVRQELWLKALQPELTEPPILGWWRVLPEEERLKAGTPRKEKRTDVNIAIHITKDVLEVKPAGIVLISGDSDFHPLVDFAAKRGVAFAVFNPQVHGNFRPRFNTPYANKMRCAHLTRDVLEECSLKRDELWKEHFELKVRHQPEFRRAYEYAKSRK